MSEQQSVTVTAKVRADLPKVWEYWTAPEHIMKWNAASDDWHTTYAENDLVTGGSFKSRMEAKDGSFGFDFGGIYDEVIPHQKIAYTMGDGRKVSVEFAKDAEGTAITESFDAEQQNSVEAQRAGWQSIMDRFKSYVEQSEESEG